MVYPSEERLTPARVSSSHLHVAIQINIAAGAASGATAQYALTVASTRPCGGGDGEEK